MSRRLTAVLAIVAGLALTVGAVLASGQGSGSNKALFGVLTGGKEVSAKGDPNGRGSASAMISGGKLCFGLTVQGVAKPLAAHIHKGGAKAEGGVVVPLKAPSGGNPGAASGCVAIKSDLAAAILKNPAGYYWNVHTKDFPAGALRGQLFAKSS